MTGGLSVMLWASEETKSKSPAQSSLLLCCFALMPKAPKAEEASICRSTPLDLSE